MNELSADRQKRWQQVVEQLERDYYALPEAEKTWLAELIGQIEKLQYGLDHLFHKAEGEQICARCKGACCAKGHNHAGLANLLSYVQQNMVPPDADFSKTCPWLGPCGCVHQARHRPYNCITFLCDKLEERLDNADVEEFYRLDQELRKLYLRVADFYSGGGMSGLLLQAARLNGVSLLSKKP